MNIRPKVFFFGPLPPPTHGMAVVNAQMVEFLGKYADVFIGDTSPKGLVRGIGYHLRKALRVLWIVCRLPVARLRGARIIYGSPDDSWGGLWTIMILALARILGMAVTLHHHSYRYLLKPRRIMGAITGIAGASAIHVVLGEDMRRRILSLYPAVRSVMICENGIDAPANNLTRNAEHGLVIGMLANLTVEKGSLEFIGTFEAMVADGLPVRAVLAGPAPDPEVETAIKAASTTFGDKFKSIGPVHGDEKEQFFAGIDLFLFPTNYATEAFPLVLLESLVRGVPVVAYRRGCIGALEGQEGVDLVELADDFSVSAIAAARKLKADDWSRGRIASAALNRNTANLSGLDQLAVEICNMQSAQT